MDSARTIIVPGSQHVRAVVGVEGLNEVFKEIGFEWHETDYSMCLSMNKDQLEGDEAPASSSSHNFIGRQRSKDGCIVLMNLCMVAAVTITREVTDVRELREMTMV